MVDDLTVTGIGVDDRGQRPGQDKPGRIIQRVG